MADRRICDEVRQDGRDRWLDGWAGHNQCMDATLPEQVRQRAGDRCEYCRLPQGAHVLTFPVDHIIARQHGGRTEHDNSALCRTVP